MVGHVQSTDDGVREVEVETFAAGQLLFDGVVFLLLNGGCVSCTRGGHGTGEAVELLNSANVVPVVVGDQDAGQTDSAYLMELKSSSFSMTRTRRSSPSASSSCGQSFRSASRVNA